MIRELLQTVSSIGYLTMMAVIISIRADQKLLGTTELFKNR
ncbi:MAG: hypothetical protein V7784_22880 [Oceanospirillaceae bacterium]